MTEPPLAQHPEMLRTHLVQALAELVPEWVVSEDPTVTPAVLLTAGRIVAERWNVKHRALHADSQRGGAVIWGMRNIHNMTWRQIYDATGIVQRTGDRWMKLFVAEGVTPRPADELDRRWQLGDNPPEGDES
jgi:hypothetical protein